MGVAGIRGAVAVLEEIGPRCQAGDNPPAGLVHGVEDRHREACGWREGRDRSDLGEGQGQTDRPGRERAQGRRRCPEGGEEDADRLPVGAPGGLVGEGAVAAGAPAGAGLELPGRSVGVAHHTGAATHRDDLALSVEAEVVVLEEEEVVAELVDQGARPVLAQVAAAGTEAVPDGAHTHLAGAIEEAGGGPVAELDRGDAADQG